MYTFLDLNGKAFIAHKSFGHLSRAGDNTITLKPSH